MTENMTAPTNSSVEARHERWSNPAAFEDVCEALSELSELMQGVIDGDYEPDSFTLQPAEHALAKARGESSQ